MKKTIKIVSKHTNLFNIVKQQDGYVITIGRNQVSQKKFANQETAEEYINSQPWELIIAASWIIAENLITLKQNNHE